jgi:hypothetical protein
VKIHRINEQATLEVIEGGFADHLVDQQLEGFTAVKGGSEKAAEGNVGTGYLKDVPAADYPGSGLHSPGRHPCGPGSRDERSDAGAYYQAGDQISLLQRPEHADVSEPFQAAATEHQGEGAIRYHSRALTKVASS